MKASKSVTFVACLLMAGLGAAHMTAAPGKPTPITVALNGLGCSTALGAGTFEARSWSWGAENVTGSGGSGEATGKAVVNALQLTRVSDACSPALLGGVVMGEHFSMLTLSQYDPGGVLKATVVLNNVLLTTWQVGGTNTSTEATEQVEASFDKFVFTDAASGNKVCYDVKAQKPFC